MDKVNREVSRMNKFKSITKLLAGTASLMTISACSVGVVADAEKVIQSDRNDATDLVRASATPLPIKVTEPIRITNDIFLGNNAKSRINGQVLPRTVERDGVILISDAPVGLIDIANIIKNTTGISVFLDEDVFEAEGGNGGGQEFDPIASSADSSGITAGGGVDPAQIQTQGLIGEPASAPPAASVNGPSTGESAQTVMMLNHEGKLSDFLNMVSQRFRINWEYKNNQIRFYRNENKTFLVQSLPATSTMGMEIASGGGEGSFGSSSQNSSTELEIDLWAEMIEGVTNLVEPYGTITASRSTGTVSVSTPSFSMRRVEEFIKQQNLRYSQQIAINVQVFNVALEDADDFSSDLNLLWEGTNNWLAGFTKVAGGATAGSGDLAWTLLKPNSPIAGTSGIVRALSTKGDVSVVTTANATTLNNVPTPIQVGNSRNYVSSSGPETDADGNVVGFLIETDTVTTGFNMQLLPRVFTNNVVGLQYNISTSELIGAQDGFDIFTAGDTTVQLPNMNSRAFTQQVMIPNGNTLILAGFEQVRSSVRKEGVGIADNWFTGGSNSGRMEREVMVIMITPTIVQTDAVIQEM